MLVNLRLREGQDDDVIAWLEQQPNKSEAIRECLRRGIAATTSPPADFDDHRLSTLVKEAVREVLADVVITAQQPDRPAPGNGHEDPVLAARLDSLFD
jgi:hypothetical protein